MTTKTLMTSGLAALLLGLGAMTQAQAQAALKIGVVNVPKLMQDSPQARAAHRTLEDEFAPKQRALQAEEKELKAQIDKFTRDSAVMAETERNKTERDLGAKKRDFERRAQDFQQDVEQRQQEEQARINTALGNEVQTFAKAQGFDLILSNVVYAKDSIDVTAAILAALEAKAKPGTPPKPAPAPAPAPAK